MKQRFIDKLTNKEKYSILYRYLIKEEETKHIWETFRRRCNYGVFQHTMSRHLLENKELLTRILKAKLPEERFEEVFYILPSCLGSKRKSYWDNETDLIFQEATYNALSIEEQLIYDKSGSIN